MKKLFLLLVLISTFKVGDAQSIPYKAVIKTMKDFMIASKKNDG